MNPGVSETRSSDQSARGDLDEFRLSMRTIEDPKVDIGKKSRQTQRLCPVFGLLGRFPEVVGGRAGVFWKLEDPTDLVMLFWRIYGDE